MRRVWLILVGASIVGAGCTSGVDVSVSATPGASTETSTAVAASAFGSLEEEAMVTPSAEQDDPAETTAAVESGEPAEATEKSTQASLRTPSTSSSNPPGDAMASCSQGGELLFRGRSEGPGTIESGSGSNAGAAEAAICRFASGELEYHGVDVTTGDEIRLTACQSAFNGWTATDAGFKYVVTDRSEDAMGSPGILSRTRPDGESTMWLLGVGIVRNPELQTKPATRCSDRESANGASAVFTSPSGNIACAMTAESVRCDIYKHEWSLAQSPVEECDLDFGNAFSLSISTAEPLCAGDTIKGESTPELSYGESSVVGPFSCLSETVGMTCTSEAGAKLFLSKQDIQMEDADHVADGPATNDYMAEIGAKVVVAPNGPLGGVALGTAAEPAIDALVKALGDPDDDSLWTTGCPLGGYENYERQIRWGPLWAIMARDPADGSDEHFSAWGIRADTADGAVGRADIQLPDGVGWDQTIAEVSSAIGGTTTTELGTTFALVDGLWFSDSFESPGSAPFVGIYIPRVSFCE